MQDLKLRIGYLVEAYYINYSITHIQQKQSYYKKFNFKNGIFYFLFGHIKAFNFVLIIVTILVYMFFVLKAANTKNEIKKRNKAMNTAYIVLFVFLYFGALSFLIDNQYYAHILIQFYLKKQKTKHIQKKTQKNLVYI